MRFPMNPWPKTHQETSSLLVKELVVSRRHVDVCETDPFFHQFANDRKVYIIQNTPQNFGIDIAIDHFQNYRLKQTKQWNSARINNDGLWLAGILIDTKSEDLLQRFKKKKLTEPRVIKAETQRCISLSKF